MIFKRLKYLAVCLLVLLSVISTMGGRNDDYKYYISQLNNSVCLSFRNNKLTDCCKQDYMQQIYVKKTGPSTGIFHIKNYKKILCYDSTHNKFRLYRGKSLGLCRTRHQSRRERESRRRSGKPYRCTLTEEQTKKVINKGCNLHEKFGAGYAYISYEEKARYLAVRRNRVRKHKVIRNRVREPKNGRMFLLMSEKDMDSIISSGGMCMA